jgi:hypothetical protein
MSLIKLPPRKKKGTNMLKPVHIVDRAGAGAEAEDVVGDIHQEEDPAITSILILHHNFS